MADLATPYPSQVFLTLFGLPLEDRARLIAWKDAIIDLGLERDPDKIDLVPAAQLFLPHRSCWRTTATAPRWHQNSTPRDLSDESTAAGAQAVFEYAHGTVRDEDYALVEKLQANLASGVREHLVFGRNEPGLQHRHETWTNAVSAVHR